MKGRSIIVLFLCIVAASAGVIGLHFSAQISSTIFPAPALCDDGNPYNGDGCSFTNHEERCGDSVMQSALGNGAKRKTPVELTKVLTALAVLDVDGDGRKSATIDGTLITRYLQGFRGAELTDGMSFAAGAVRTTPEAIAAFIEGQGKAYDIDGDGQVLPQSDAALIFRYLSGVTGFPLVGELCDDGNATSGDGCSAQCAPEEGWTCLGMRCTPVCGDGRKMGIEACEKGIACVDVSLTCRSCSCVASNATASRRVIKQNGKCNNATLDPGEQCDLPAFPCANGGQCSDSCTCGAAGGTSTVQMVNAASLPRVCGDGKVTGSEQCDRGYEDRCVAGKVCRNCRCVAATASSSSAKAVCGDGEVDPTVEQCDTGEVWPCTEVGLVCVKCRCAARFNSSSSAPVVCGDGLVSAPFEQCDTGEESRCEEMGLECRDCICVTRSFVPISSSSAVRSSLSSSPPLPRSSSSVASGFHRCLDGFICTAVKGADGSCFQFPKKCDVVETEGVCGGVSCPGECQRCAGSSSSAGEACASMPVAPAGCGNGRIDTRDACTAGPSSFGFELCDDGNLTPGDGCDASCNPEPGWACSLGTSPTFCARFSPLGPAYREAAGTCGNGLVEAGEQCDDGNTFGGDGCSCSCAIESGWVCEGALSTCCAEAGACGDGVRGCSEACDDGNAVDGDGCSKTCAVERGFLCASSPSACAGACSERVRQSSSQSLNIRWVKEGEFCGGFGAIRCEAGLTCRIESNIPDAGGICVKE